MSDHISGPRALAEPIADITDVYAFPSPERPGHIVLVVNTRPFAQPSDFFSDGLVYRFRLHPLTTRVQGHPVPFAVVAEERSEEHTSELQSLAYLLYCLLLEK